ncbi:RTX-I toxin determinant B [Bordetella pertussis]|uniref:RTX-I toxin determinant B n=1 Tax=Bordetella pertussis TaxID=520 RepID=A0A376C1W0_BORPT|nr:ABC transporter ATP-binding protein [Bordetella pertussis]SSZ75567.1 RTX-I toxin determinant B [Bordetella pertussis]
MLLAAASQVLALIDPIIFGRIIDEYAIGRAGKTGDQLLAGVLGLLALALAVAILSRLAKALQEYVTRLVVQKLGTQIFNDGLRQVMRLRFQEFEELRSGETLSLLQKVRSDSERFINAFINTAFAAGVGVAFLCWYSVTRHWLLVPVFFVGVLLLGGLTGLLSRQIRSQQRSIMRETNRNSGFITESLRNIELIKSLGLTYPEIRRLQAQTQQIFALEMQKIKRIRLLSFLQGMILSVLKLSVLFALLWLILRDVLSTGELIAMQFISVAIFAPLQELGNLILAYREADASLNHYAALMARPVERNPESAQDSGPIQRVRFGEVRFRHQGAAENALDGVSFEARLGDTVAFVGPSGSGKSTLFKLLVGLYAPDRRSLLQRRLDARPALQSDPAPDRLRHAGNPSFLGTLRENMQLVKPDVTDEEIVAAMRQASCANVLARSPAGLDTTIGEGGVKLSGGERQRLSIARALVRQPRLLIFDEATSALDSLTEEQITQTIRDVSRRAGQIPS